MPNGHREKSTLVRKYLVLIDIAHSCHLCMVFIYGNSDAEPEPPPSSISFYSAALAPALPHISKSGPQKHLFHFFSTINAHPSFLLMSNISS